MNTNLQLLQGIPLFHGFAESDLVELENRSSMRTIKAGEMLFRLGDQGDSMFVIVSGKVEVSLPPGDENSSATVLQELGTGDFFGEMALLDSQPRMAGVTARADSLLLELTRESLLTQLRQSPQLVPAMLSVMSNRLRIAARLLGTPSARNINEEADGRMTWGQRLADTIAKWNGSWGFILVLSIASTLWVLVNVFPGLRFDPYPYQFLNVFLAILVALQGPVIMMSQNRQMMKERLHSEADYLVNLKNETGIYRILRELSELRHEVAILRGEKIQEPPTTPPAV